MPRCHRHCDRLPLSTGAFQECPNPPAVVGFQLGLSLLPEDTRQQLDALWPQPGRVLPTPTAGHPAGPWRTASH